MSICKGFRVNLTWDKKKQTYGCYINENIAGKVYNKVKELRYQKGFTHAQIRDAIKFEFGAFTIQSQLNPKGYRFIDNSYQVRVKKNGREFYIGSYRCPQEAHQACLKAKAASL